MPLRRWTESANNAIEGILFAAKSEPHLRCHLFAAAVILFLSYILGLPRVEFLIITIVIIMVLFVEMLNTAIEYIVDMLSPEYSEKARIIKDISAGAVLVTVSGAIVTGYIVFFPFLKEMFDAGVSVARHSDDEIALISALITIITVVLIKALLGRGHPLRGGMPSGHSAIAFSFWISVSLITESFSVSIVVFALAAMIAHSRLMIGAHTYSEIIVGAVLGSGLTLILFFVFR